MNGRFFPLRNEGGPLHLDGLAVHRARRAAGLTQAQLAHRTILLGYFLPQPYVSLLEHGRPPGGTQEARLGNSSSAA